MNGLLQYIVCTLSVYKLAKAKDKDLVQEHAREDVSALGWFHMIDMHGWRVD